MGGSRIIGIVADVRDDGLRNPIKPQVYVPYTAQMWMFTQILVCTRVPPLSIVRAIRAEIVKIDPEQQAMRVRDLETWITPLEEYAQQRLVATLFGIFSVLALALAAVGLYSVVSYGVATRTNEFAIRMALGAKAADVIRIVLSSTAIQVGSGVAVGIALSIAFNKLATKWVTESSRDPMLVAGVTQLLVITAALACLVPARRAASVDPMEALRCEQRVGLACRKVLHDEIWQQPILDRRRCDGRFLGFWARLKCENMPVILRGLCEAISTIREKFRVSSVGRMSATAGSWRPCGSRAPQTDSPAMWS